MHNVAEVACAVERMRPGLDQVWSVADVVHPSCAHEYVGIRSDEVSNRFGLAANPLGMCPPARQRVREQLFGQVARPPDMFHMSETN
jgi:hypothetical protein